MGRRSWSAVVCLVVVVALVIGQSSLPGRPAPAPAAPAADNAAAAHMAGRASCSGRACHGGLEAVHDGAQQNEFTTWLAHDKHAQAFAVLKSPRAERMARNLGIAAADKDPRCLACHTTPQLAGPVSEELAALRSDGVSCEACHGEAKGTDPWLTAHTAAGWTKLAGKAREDAYRQHGMTQLFDLEVQAKTCAGCHVGAPADPEHGIPARDLNHDLMAAGHPRLTFELGTYRANMPPHWRADLHAKTPGYEAAVWSIGQAASAKASADLLAHRAREAAAAKAPWPEFAEASCFACHADLQGHKASWRKADYYGGRRPGAIPVNRWYVALLPALESVVPGKTGAASQAFQALAAEMNKPYPDPKKAGPLAETVSKELAGVLAALKPVTFDAAPRKALTRGLAQQAGTFKMPDWDELTQAALAGAALRDAAGSEAKAEGQPSLDEVFRALAFPPSYESPEGFSPQEKPEGAKEDVHALVLKFLQGLAR